MKMPEPMMQPTMTMTPPKSVMRGLSAVVSFSSAGSVVGTYTGFWSSIATRWESANVFCKLCVSKFKRSLAH